uniref:Uncharacterized protein n=1 Tax=Avena sativa TaxID=4498 RepID=A0ACD5Z5Z7_AVESA
MARKKGQGERRTPAIWLEDHIQPRWLRCMLAHTTCAVSSIHPVFFTPRPRRYIRARRHTPSSSTLVALLEQDEQSRAMRGPSTTKSFKQGFLRSFLLSLKSCGNGAMVLNLQERKRAVRSSADAAMATARGGGARWPQALLAAAAAAALPTSSSSSSWSRLLPSSAAVKTTRHKKVARRCCHTRRTTVGSSVEIARRLVRKRTKVLRGMVPGGELLDGVSLLREAMDYVVHLRAQVAVLRRVSNAMQHMAAGPVAPRLQLKGETAQASVGNEE